MNRTLPGLFLVTSLLLPPEPARAAEPVPASLKPWLGPQEWKRDTEGPILSLGPAGAFDDMHIFAPCVARENGLYHVWYSGSRGEVARRVFALGLAESDDGRRFTRHADNPVFRFGDDRHSVLTAALLRGPGGDVLREDGKLRLWFSSTDFTDRSGRHTLHETTSADGVHWNAPSAALLEGVYAPTILKDGDRYRLWYTDVSGPQWVFRHADSVDGRRWQVTREPVLRIDQEWEQGRLFYPAVVKVDDVYLMWYGSYWSARAQHTAIGFAVSTDGLHWNKSPHNPVLRPDPGRPWESHYTTSQTVMRLPDGTWRIWYASRTKPPFVHKYYAIGTATWAGPSQVRQER